MLKDIPLLRMIENYINENNTLFHMPGHKGGRAFSYFNAMSFLEKAGSYDLTEVPGTDNLIFPEEEIKEALLRCAEAFGADSSFFLVNGATGGIHALIGAACRPGDKLIVARDCHRSVINAMMLFNVEPVYIFPGVVEKFGITGVVRPEDVEKAISENPDCAGVFITRPTYYGLCCDIEAISVIARKYNKLLLVDEAHGAHLPFGGDLYPDSSIRYADACVQSAHKTLAALNQGAYLHLRGGRISVNRVRKMLQTLMTTSPSYLIMASLDFSRSIMESCGNKLLKDLYENIAKFKILLSEETGFTVLDSSYCSGAAVCPDRIVIRTSDAGFTGYEAEKYLRLNHNVQVEMSDLYNIVLLATVFNTKEDFEKLLGAMKGLWKQAKNPGNNNSDLVKNFSRDFTKDFSKGLAQALNKQRKSLLGRSLLFKDTELVPLEKSSGRPAGEPVVLYPPGIPLLVPGDVIEEEDIDFMKNILYQGGKINGLVSGGDNGENIYIPCFLDEV